MTHQETITAKIDAYNLPRPDAHGYVNVSTGNDGELFIRQVMQFGPLGFELSEAHFSLAPPYWARLHLPGAHKEPIRQHALATTDAHRPSRFPVIGEDFTSLPSEGLHFAPKSEFRCVEYAGQKWYSAADICNHLRMSRPGLQVKKLGSEDKERLDVRQPGTEPWYVTSAGASQLAVIATGLDTRRDSNAGKGLARGRRASVTSIPQRSVTYTESRTMTIADSADKLAHVHAQV